MPVSNPPVNSPVYRADYYSIELHSRGGVLALRRTSAPFLNLEAAQTAHREVLDRLQMFPRRTLGLLVDLRAAPSRNDPEFEETVKDFRQALFALFLRAAILVRTATGKMQLTRHVRSDGGTTRIFDDEEQAVEFLRQK